MTNKEAAVWLLNLRADIGKAQHSDLWHYEQALQEIQEILESDVPHKKIGKWVKTGQSFVNPNTFLGYSCSCCGFYVPKEDPLYLVCPSCYAEMEKGETDE